jgi:diguanylate cyclase (GGDEF)-like protein
VTAFAGAALRIFLREEKSINLKYIYPFQKPLSVLFASIPILIMLEKPQPHPIQYLLLLSSAPLYTIFEAFVEGIAIGTSLLESAQANWFKARYQTLLLSFAAPLIGTAAAFYKNQVNAIVLIVCIFLLQAAAFSLFKKETAKTSAVILEELEKTKVELEIEKKRSEELEQSIERKTLEQGLLLDFGEKIGSKLSLDEIFKVMQDFFKQVFSYQSCIIFFTNTERGTFFLQSNRFDSPYGNLFKDLHLRLGETIVGMCAKEKKSLLTTKQKARPYSLLIENELSEMAVPLIPEGEIKGVIYIGNPEPIAYSEANLQLFTILGYQAAMVLTRAQSYEKTETLAKTDGLTGLYTHRHFQEKLADEVKRSERYHQPLCLIMMDLDHFKEYNDSFGHPQGDALLKKISQILKDCTRESDIVCRYGGDEFAILLLETTKETAMSIARRIREAVELRVNTGISRVKITCSIGVAAYPDDSLNKSDLLFQADRALYDSKEKGRNQVVAATKR